MTEPSFLTTPQGRQIAYHKTDGAGPGIVFLGGFKSDMDGTKAVHFEDWARAQGRAYLRLDYSGHGRSSGDFLDGCIGDWAEDAQQAIAALTTGPQILVGSSMGGWISLLTAKAMPDRIAGLVGLAAAPDFTEDGYWARFDEAERATLMTEGVVHVPSDYGDPYPITRRLIENGRQVLVLRDPLDLPFPVRFVQGTADAAVSTETALHLLDHATSPDMRLTLIDGADHRLSTPDELAVIVTQIEDVLSRQKGD